jgi:hypothetical protein
MTTNTGKRERRDWTLLIFIIPVGILLIIIVGQLAARLLPFWSVNAGMRSNLEPNPESARPFALLEPILPQILTPMAWIDIYLTPGAEISFPPFLTFEPSATPSPTVATPTATGTAPTPTATPSTPVPTSSSTTGTPPTNTPPDGNTETPTTGTPATGTPTTGTPTTGTPTTGTPTTGTPTTGTPTTGTPSATPTTPSPTGVVSTVPPSYSQVTPAPTEIGTTPDNSAYQLVDGTYVVINLSVVVGGTPDNNYDLVFYEFNNGGVVFLDWVIIGISNSPLGGDYYEVFNWGNSSPDTNTNVDTANLDPSSDCPSNTECNDRHFNDDPNNPSEPSNPNSLYNGSGVLIDVDSASSSPPPGQYDYIVIISPLVTGEAPNNGSQVDAIQTVEIPTPTP